MNKQNKGYIVDVVSGRTKNLKLLLKKNISNKNHANKGKEVNLSNEILTFIDNEIDINKNKYEKLKSLLKLYNY